MPSGLTDDSELEAIRALAADPDCVRITKTVQFDLMAHDLTKEEICDVILAWIADGNRVKKVGEHVGQPAFEMKPRINSVLFYLKVTICEQAGSDNYLLLISVHPDH